MKVAVIGGNNFGKVHLEILSSMNVDLLVYDRNENVLSEDSKKYNAVPYSSMSKAMEDSDVVDIVLPHYLHKDTAMRALEMGKHVLVEKPIALNSSEGAEMIRKAKAVNRKFMVLENYFFEPPVKKACDLINEGRIGKVRGIRFTKIKRVDPTPWGCSQELMGGGSFVDDGIHLADAFLNVGGDCVEVSAMRFNLHHSEMAGEDTLSATVKFASGAFGSIIHSWAFDEIPSMPRLEILGTEGWITEMPEYRKQPRKFGNLMVNGKEEVFDPYNPFRIGISGFIDAVSRDESVPMPPEIALRDIVFVESAYKSSPVIHRIN
ncbi:MAG: Gfo/Idh/MocA family oxidoreductase [Candidatus Thermoplasmatota archaeon]|nr:Gfo/Idh/MocA family oxidoreductase [Candidatus Sysuiplasma jiujiangense]MBX8641601.1 Gfo/Idh/MocA family oxidoreductase [Candidatus Sysuiplasma jiujiangense]MCL4318111.1 Gfo/Idh/MocA family oxidoreductase [Candidatus Thermoplasmatota archaeon]